MKNRLCCWILAIFGVFLLLILLGGGFLIFFLARGAGDEIVVKKDSFLLIELTGRVEDYRAEPRFDFFSDRRSPTLAEALRALDHARTDSRIKGVLLKPMGSGGFASLRELREAVRNFKASGKPVYAYLEIATDRDFYLASVADSIVMVPSHSGGMVLLGLSIAKTYLGGTFEKFGLKFNVLHIGDFKGAYEHLEREDMSDSLRLSLQTLLDDMFETYVAEAAAGRKIVSVSELKNELLNGTDYLISGSEALEKRYVDLVLDWEELQERLGGGEDINTVSARKYARVAGASPGTKEIAVVSAEGQIDYMPDRTDPFDHEDAIHPERFIKQLKELREDDEVAAVVLRVNSPGGSSLASELILQEVKRLKAAKPVVVSMGNVAASGGYYISCAANYIVAQPNTITGSIGVVSVVPTAEELYRKVAAHVDVVEKGKWGQFFRFDKTMTAEQEKILLNLMDGVYRDFISHVAEGRNLTESDVNAVASGRVWTGAQALDRHLIDELGGLDMAVRKAEELAEVSESEVRIRFYPKEEGLFRFLMERFGSTLKQIRHDLLLSADERQILRAAEYLNSFMNRREFIQLLAPIDTDF